MRALAWMALLAWLVACGKQGSPMRHPPAPRHAQESTAPAPVVSEPQRTEPAAPEEETDNPGEPSEPEVSP